MFWPGHEHQSSSCEGTASSPQAIGSKRPPDSAGERASGDVALQCHPSDHLVVYFFVVEYKRNPGQLWEWLYRNERLAACRNALAEAGHENRLPCGSTVSVMPEHLKAVLDHLKSSGVVCQDGERLPFSACSPSHMIVAEELIMKLSRFFCLLLLCTSHA